jgi:hypothetical protein
MRFPKVLLAAAILSTSLVAVAQQGVIIQGEASPGVYNIVKTDGAGKLLVSNAGTIGAPISGTITSTAPTVTTTTSQVLVANASRKLLIVQNNDAAGIVYVNFGAAATVANYKLPPAGVLHISSGVPTQTINLIGSIASNALVVVLEGQ